MGIDLVRLQLRIAAGEPLPFGQEDVTVSGHAIEARVYAEDSYGGFLPQAGTAAFVAWPEGVRVDAALESGQAVSTAYDPMLGKVIAHGPDREAARRSLMAALDDTVIVGLTTNTGFLRELVAGDAFTRAEIDTAWLDRVEPAPPDDSLARVIAAWASARDTRDSSAGPFAADGWRLGARPAPVVVEFDTVHRVGADDVDGVAAREIARVARAAGVVDLTLELDGMPHRGVVALGGHAVEVVHQGQRWVFRRLDAFGDDAVHVGDGTVLAPMPGTMVAVEAAPGDAVVAGQALGIMEAMKMELSLTAPFDGTVVSVGAQSGDRVALGDRLFVVEPAAGS